MDYLVEYSKRKDFLISVRGGILVVKAPVGASKDSIDKIVQKHRRWIEKHLPQAQQRVEFEKELTEEKIKELKKAAKKYMTEKTEYYAKIMDVKYGRITITSAKTRFGSCSANKDISYSYRVMLYPEKAREYVVVHELTHTYIMDHSQYFYGILSLYMPDYKEREKLLKDAPQL